MGSAHTRLKKDLFEQLLKTALTTINLKTRYLDEEQERHGLNQNPVYISVHDFEASRA